MMKLSESFLLEKQPRMKAHSMEDNMRKEYDFSKAVKNPYLHKLKKQISIRLEVDTIEYFKSLADETGIKYQHLINLFLNDCAKKHLKPKVIWKA